MSNYSEKSYKWRDLVYRIVYHAFWIFEAVLLIYLFYIGELSGIKAACFAAAYVFLSCVCMIAIKEFDLVIVYHSLFLYTKFKLAAYLFDGKMQIVIAVIVMTAANILVKLLLQFIILKLELDERWLCIFFS